MTWPVSVRRVGAGSWQRPLVGVGGQEAVGVVLRLLDVGLIEGVDADQRARDGGGELPAEELRAHIVGIAQRQAHDRLPRRFEAGDGGVLGGIEAFVRAQVDEDAVLAVDGGIAQRFALDGQDAFAFFAGALGDQLLQPVAKGGDGWRDGDGRPCRAREARPRRGWRQARHRDFSRQKHPPRRPDAWRRARSSSFATSMPRIAAGTIPKKESAE